MSDGRQVDERAGGVDLKARVAGRERRGGQRARAEVS